MQYKYHHQHLQCGNTHLGMKCNQLQHLQYTLNSLNHYHIKSHRKHLITKQNLHYTQHMKLLGLQSNNHCSQ